VATIPNTKTNKNEVYPPVRLNRSNGAQVTLPIKRSKGISKEKHGMRCRYTRLLMTYNVPTTEIRAENAQISFIHIIKIAEVAEVEPTLVFTATGVWSGLPNVYRMNDMQLYVFRIYYWYCFSTFIFRSSGCMLKKRLSASPLPIMISSFFSLKR
jgi:hypothetical protein